MPRVSIIVPFLNAESFFVEAIDSVRAQSFRDWELLLVDDGSSDGSTEMARRWSAEVPDRVRYFQHPGGENRGISASLNLGIRHASGDLVAFLDADDVWLPSKLEEQVKILDEHPRAAMVFGPSQFWFSWTGKPEDRHRDTVVRLGLPPEQVVEPPRMLLGMLDRTIPAPPPCAVLVRKAVLEEVGGFEEKEVPNSHSDQSFYAKLLLHSPVYASKRCWTRYRQRPGSSVAVMKESGRRDRDRRDLLQWFSNYVDHRGVFDEQLRRVLDAELAEVLYRLASRPRRLARNPRRAIRSLVRRTIPAGVLDRYRRRRHPGLPPPPGRVRFGDLRRLEPFSRRWGYDRGQPVDRYYIERFLGRHASDIRGRILEVGGDAMTWRFGGTAVTGSDVLDIKADDPKTTLVADLNDRGALPAGRFDCIIFPQTLQLLEDFRTGLDNLHRMLKPGGVLLATFPGIGKIGGPADGGTWLWSFTVASAERLFRETFPSAAVSIETGGNVMSATAFLWGLSAEELKPDELEFEDPEYPVTIAVRAVKAGELR